LKKLDCDYGQGYLISRPMPAVELERNFLDNKVNKTFFLNKRIG
jgi:EAL domain-containing protein (putative c-di-GMP-specific phosphodiesterase class I)